MRSVRRASAICLFVVASAAACLAAPPEAPATLTVGAGKVKEFTVKPSGNKDFGFRLVGGPAAFREMKGDAPGERVFWLIPETDAPISIVWWTVGEKASAVTEVNKGAKPDVAPEPKPKPDDPKPPAPVASFRVLLVYESGDTLTAAQNGVLYGKAVEEYLAAKCTKDGTLAGWRRRDKDAATTGDTATMNALWAAVKPAVTSTPCVALEVNGKVTIEPLPATVAMLKKYAGDK